MYHYYYVLIFEEKDLAFKPQVKTFYLLPSLLCKEFTERYCRRYNGKHSLILAAHPLGTMNVLTFLS